MKIAIVAIVALAVVCFAELGLIVWQAGTIAGLEKRSAICEAAALTR